MKKNFFFAMMMTLIAYSTSYSQTEVLITSEIRTEHEEKVTPLIEVHVDGPIEGKFGWIASGLLSKHESEAYGGFTYSPKEGIQLSAAAGIETKEHHQSPIGVFSLKLEKEQWSFLHDSKIGKSGYSTKNTLKRKVSSGFAMGVYGETDFGIGPYGEQKLGKHFALFGSLGFGYHKPKGIVGLKYHFELK